jgi:hypothetical protein
MKSTPLERPDDATEQIRIKMQKASVKLRHLTQKEAKDFDVSVWDGLENLTNDDSTSSINQSDS